MKILCNFNILLLFVVSLLSLNLNAQCTPSGNVNWNNFGITNVSIIGDGGSSINNNSGIQQLYVDNTGLSIDATAGSTYNFSITNQKETWGNLKMRFWIDYDGVGNYVEVYDSGNYANNNNGTQTFTGNFTIDASAVTGSVVLRIAASYCSNCGGGATMSVDGCTFQGRAEIEDYTLNISASTAPSQDFNVQHIQADVARNGGTITSFDPVIDTNNAFVLPINNRKTHAGSNGFGSDLEGDDMSGAVSLTSVSTLEYYRASGSRNINMRFNSSIWEYIGPTGGDNEMIVRDRFVVNLNGSTNSVTRALTGITNANKCIPFITGIINNSGSDDADSSTAITYLENASTLRIQKGSNANNIVVYITLVEFTGSNWQVFHGDSGNVSGDSGTITLRQNANGTGTETDVSDWDDSIIFGQHRGDNNTNGINDAIADNWPVFNPGTNNRSVNWTFNNNHDSNGQNRQFVHILSNTNINVSRFQNTDNPANQTTIDISSAGLTDINKALIVGSSTSSGGGTAYGRGWRNYYLNSTNEAAHWSHRSGNTMSHEIQIIDLANLLTFVGQEIEITGNSLPIDSGDITPDISDGTDFGSTDVGFPVTETFTINNLGSFDLSISDIMLSNTTDFSIVGAPYSSPIAPSGSTTFTIQYNAVGNSIPTCLVTINNDDADESVYTFLITAESKQSFFDSDGDGIFDNVDIDDDNDGITDTDEELACKNSNIAISTNYKFLNETFGEGTNRTTINTTYNAITTYNYEDGSGGNLGDGKYTVYYQAANGDGINQTPNGEVAVWADQYWFTGEDHTSGDTNGRMAMFNASFSPGLFYTASITGALPNVPITYSFWVLNLDTTTAPGINSRLRPNILVEFRKTNGDLLASITTGDIPPSNNSDPDNSWKNFTADLTFNVSEFDVFFYNNETGGLGNDLAIDDISIVQTLCDTDNDGIANVFDLDSDDDGIPDVVEAGFGNISNGTGLINSWIDNNGNGMHDAVEGLTILDSDGDGTPNVIDLDSDNDSIFDVDESGASNSGDTNFQNGDGDVDGDGLGDGGDTDYVREKDYDSDGASEYFADGILDIYDFHEGATMADAYGNTNQGNGNTYYVLDTDGDGIPDYIDVYNDNTGIYDISQTLYADLDANSDGIIDDTNDADSDGIVDLFDTNDAQMGSPRDLDRKLTLYFDGRNDYVQDEQIISGWSEITMMGWIKLDPTLTNVNRTLFGQTNFYLRITHVGRLRTVGPGKNILGPIIPTGQWVHISATFSDTQELIKLFVNGEEVTSNANSGPLDTDTSSFTLGKLPFVDNHFFKGQMDEVRLFNKALSENEIQKIVYQEIEQNGTNIRGTEIPRDITDFVDVNTITPLPWSNLIRYYRLDNFKGDITDNLTTPAIDTGTGAKLYNIKQIEYQSAPMPFITQASGNLETAVSIPAVGVVGNDAITYDWSIVRIEHDDVTFNDRQKHLGLFINEEDISSSPIEFHVTNDSELNVSWYLNLDGFIDLEGESQLVQGEDSILDVNSKGKIERDQQGTADTYTYNYWSSPVILQNSTLTSYRVSDILYDGTDPNNPLSINFISSGYDGAATSPITTADYWIWKFANRTSDDYSQWQHIRSTGTMSIGEGFTMKGPGSGSISSPQNYVFSGKPNNGTIDLNISANNDYLVGNPYPSAIDANTFIIDNGPELLFDNSPDPDSTPLISGTLYFWEHWGGGSHILSEYQGGYATYNFSGAVGAVSMGTNDPDVATGGTPTKIPGRYIPVGQGFFVTAENSGTINFNNGQRIFEKESASSVFLRSTNSVSAENHNTNEDIDKRLKFRIGFNSINSIHRQLLLTIDENSTIGVDWGYDGKLNEIQIDDMFWMINDDKYVIQASDRADTSEVFPLGIRTDSDGINSITIDALENVPNDFNIYLHDIALNIYHDLRESDYDIFLNAGDYEDRFEITFSTYSDVLGTDDNVKDSLAILYSNDIKKIILINPNHVEIKSMKLYNLLGQEVSTYYDIINSHHSEYNVHGISAGAYIINLLTTDDLVLTKKIIIE
jgi:hypothetical protein